MLKRLMKMAKIVINGVEITGANSVVVNNGSIYVNGDLVNVGVTKDQQRLEIQVIDGAIGELKADGNVQCAEVTGNVDAGGSVDVMGDVGGSVDAGGSVSVQNSIGGDVDAGGSVQAGGHIHGDVDAGGSVKIFNKNV